MNGATAKSLSPYVVCTCGQEPKSISKMHAMDLLYAEYLAVIAAKEH